MCKITKKIWIEQEPEHENGSSTLSKSEICRDRAEFDLEFKGGEVGFVDFAETEGVGDEAFASFDFDEVFAPLPAVVESETKGIFVIVGFEIPLVAIGITVV